VQRCLLLLLAISYLPCLTEAIHYGARNVAFATQLVVGSPSASPNPFPSIVSSLLRVRIGVNLAVHPQWCDAPPPPKTSLGRPVGIGICKQEQEEALRLFRPWLGDPNGSPITWHSG
jgi:hypothetical protein